MAKEETDVEYVEIVLRMPEPLYKWYELATEFGDAETVEEQMIYALAEDIRMWMETDDMHDFALKKSFRDGLHHAFRKLGVEARVLEEWIAEKGKSGK